MKHLITAGTFLFMLLVLLPGVPNAGELFLCRDVLIREPIETGLADRLKEKASSLFRPGDKIVAVYLFKQTGTENLVEFKWKRRLGANVRLEEKSYLHRISGKSPGDYLSFAWLDIQSGLFDLAIGSSYAGDWLVEVYIDHKQVAAAEFTIRHH